MIASFLAYQSKGRARVVPEVAGIQPNMLTIVNYWVANYWVANYWVAIHV
jgi:hypothetical protein